MDCCFQLWACLINWAEAHDSCFSTRFETKSKAFKKKKLAKLALFSIKLVSGIHLNFLKWVGLKNKTEKVEGIMCHCTILEQLLKERIICAPASKQASITEGNKNKNYKASSVDQKWETTFLHVHATIFSFLAMFSPSFNTC